MHYYKRNLGDYAKKAGRLSMLQHGAYTLLIDACYDRERFPTLDEAIEWTWASTEAEIEAVKFVLSRFFTLNEVGQYVQERILQEVLEYQAKADKNKEIAIERETKRRENKTKREVNITKRERIVHVSPPNQEPITNNQEPLVKDIGVAKATKATRLKLDSLPEDWFNWCRGERPDLNPITVWDHFKDHWVSVPGQKGCKLDWFATWRNWVRNQWAKPRSNLNNRHDSKMKTLSGLTGGIHGNTDDAKFKPITETIDMETSNANLLR